MGFPVNDYNQEFTDAWDRTLRFGLALPPIRLQVRKGCIDLAKALPVIVDCFNQHSSDQLRSRTAAIHNMLQPRLSEALGGHRTPPPRKLLWAILALNVSRRLSCHVNNYPTMGHDDLRLFVNNRQEANRPILNLVWFKLLWLQVPKSRKHSTLRASSAHLGMRHSAHSWLNCSSSF
jgi:hypothetical protein